MKFSWLFGTSEEARHLLYAYVAVWLIQGGYALWIGLQWRRTRKAVDGNAPTGRTDVHQDTRL